MIPDSDHFALFDADGGGAVALFDLRRTLAFDAIDACRDREAESELAFFFSQIEAAAAGGEWVALAADYALGACFEPVLAPADSRRPCLRAWVFGRAQHLNSRSVARFLAERTANLPEWQKTAGIAELSAALDATSHAAKVEQIRAWIAEGDCYQINLTFPMHLRVYGHPLSLYARLRARQPVRYGGFIATPDTTLLSYSPELFFARQGDRVVTRPMKGTAPRANDAHADLAQRDVLLTSAKERAENIMIVDLLRNDLSKLAAPGKVRVEALCAAEAYPTLWQMVSTVVADLPGITLLELFRALFPCGSITGAPKIRAMQRISELEVAPRGLYTGALGWVAPGGDCRFNVAIRTLEVELDGQATLGIGSGIVIDANAEREYTECLLKASFLTGYDPGFELIETMRLEQGVYPMLELHLARLTESARTLGFSYANGTIMAALAECAAHHRHGVWRVRSTLAHDGRYRTDVANLSKTDHTRQLQVVLADERLDDGDYLLRHKTTARGRYDRVLATLADRTDVFDAVFLNTKGEVCEGARSNVFVARRDGADGILLTPPLACGLLPGVMRRHLLDSGRAVECVLRRDDLLGARQVYMANALRGLLPVALVV